MIGPFLDSHACTPTARLQLRQDPRPAPDLGYDTDITIKDTPAPIQAGKRWLVERTHSWMNGYGKLLRFTDKRKNIVEFYLYLVATLTIIRA
jgi:hypothetical protein